MMYGVSLSWTHVFVAGRRQPVLYSTLSFSGTYSLGFPRILQDFRRHVRHFFVAILRHFGTKLGGVLLFRVSFEQDVWLLVSRLAAAADGSTCLRPSLLWCFPVRDSRFCSPGYSMYFQGQHPNIYRQQFTYLQYLSTFLSIYICIYLYLQGQSPGICIYIYITPRTKSWTTYVSY